MKKFSRFLAGLFLASFWSAAIFAQGNFIRGDANCDGVVDSADVAAVNTCVFAGPCPCRDAADVNDDGVLSPPDATFLVNYLNSAGPPPPNPFPECGADPTADGLPCATSCCTPQNHYKTWSTNFIAITPISVQVRDQFMTEVLNLRAIQYLSNPVRKVVAGDTSHIIDADDHLLWYQGGSSTQSYFRVDYLNQFQDISVLIGPAQYFLVPATKQPHPPYDSLDHYKAYPILSAAPFGLPVQLQDQFDVTPENITSFTPRYFLTPAQKNTEPVYDTVTHYVAYQISPPRSVGQSRTVIDQFGSRTVNVGTSQFLLVPTMKLGFRRTECSDGLDNDGDGLVDYPADCGCTSGPSDDSEAPNATTQCNDGVDNDGDGLTDLADCGCANECDGSESPNPVGACNDGADNDGDGLIDLADPGCTNVCDTSEFNPSGTECGDGVDNDGDGLVDYPADCGCTGPADPTEAPNPPSECSDGVDNDGDGLIDFPADPECGSVCDNEESPTPADTGKNHYKTWSTNFTPFTATAQVKDQFLTEDLQLTSIVALSNPVQKVVAGDTFNIVDPDDHLLWYQARGRRTLLEVDYVNQFESTTVQIDTVQYFLTPAQKLPHPPYDRLDHYKAYRITNQQAFNLPVQLRDQFDLTPEQITSLYPEYFLTPAQKNAEPVYDTVTHYVAYAISPGRSISQTRTVIDQFGSHSINAGFSSYLLVPTRKLAFRAPECGDNLDNDGDGFVDYPADCGCTSATDFTESPNPPTACSDGIDNDGDGLIDLADPDCADICDGVEGVSQPHYKTWVTSFLTVSLPPVQVRDQFMTENLQLTGIQFLSNPTLKVVSGDSFKIVDPDDHLLWYRSSSPGVSLRVDYVNQFESTSVGIGQTQYFLVPAQKLPHPLYDSLDHYKAYQIQGAPAISLPVQLQDQFDVTPEQITTLFPQYFLTPAQKNAEPVYDTVTHYVAYSISPSRSAPQTRTVIDQFGTRNVNVQQSIYLLVPTRKVNVRPPDCSDGLDNDGDGLIDYPADCGCFSPTDFSESPNPPTQCSDGVDNDGDGLVDSLDCGCTDPCDQTEDPNPPTQCSDGVDNDGDGFIDFPADPDCDNVCDTSEATPLPECSDGIDNDGDGLVDFPADCGCTAATDLTEAPNPPTQCSDGADNDGDGLVDLADPDCANVCDPEEGISPILNHYKTWRTMPMPFQGAVILDDQFIADDVVRLDTIDFLSNPARKATPDDTTEILRPNDHLTWYGAVGRNFPREIQFRNQFGMDTVRIDTLDYLLVPTQKLPHPAPERLDHYKCYRVRNPRPFSLPISLQDQFDTAPEFMNILTPKYFCTPCQKNGEPVYDTVTHYVGYFFDPQPRPVSPRVTVDQFGQRELIPRQSELLLVPSDKTFVCPCAKGDVNCDGNYSAADGVCLLNCVFLGTAAAPCRCELCVSDVNCDGGLSASDVVLELNRIFLGLTAPPWCGS